VAAFLVRPLARIVRPPELPLEIDFYENARQLNGEEIRDALAGKEGFDKKITAGGQRSVTLYRAVPIVAGGWVSGAVVASETTYPILQDLYAIR
jgi:two-component system sensor histidine kinase ChvG